MLPLTLCALLLPAAPARAGQWAVTYSGTGNYTGSASCLAPWTFTDTNSQAPADSPQGAPNLQITGGTVSCGGEADGAFTLPVTTTLTWMPSGPGDGPSPAVIVTETASASFDQFILQGQGVSYGADDGLGDAATPSSQTGDGYQQTSSGTHFTALSVPSGQTTVPLPTRSLSASLTYGSAVTSGTPSLSLSYTAAVYPITIDLSGTDTSTGTNEALTGQQVTATLNLHGTPTAPRTPVTYSWPSSNANLFKNWSEKTVPQMTAWAGTDYTGQTFTFYDAHAEAVTLSCTVTFTTPDNVSHTLPITSPPVTFIKPTGTFQANNWTPPSPGPPSGFQDASPSYFGGRTWWHDVSISVPAGSPPSFSGGSACFSQIASLTRSNTGSYNGKTVTWQKLYVNNSDGTQRLVTTAVGADPGFQYTNVFETNSTQPISQWSVGDNVFGGDFPTQFENPTQNNGTSYIWSAAHASDSFTTYLMYKPPSNGATSVWVPLSSLTWSWGGDASTSTGTWVATGTGPMTGTSTATTTPPTWTATVPTPYTQP